MKHFIIKTSRLAALFVGIASTKKFLLLLTVCLSVFAVNVQANEADDAVAIEHLQKQIDAENRAAHDKAEKKWQEEHNPSGGGGGGGLLVAVVLIALVVSGIFGSDSAHKTRIFACICGGIIICVGLVWLMCLVFSFIFPSEKPSSNPPPSNQTYAQPATAPPNTQPAADAEQSAEAKAKVEEFFSLQSQLTTIKDEAAKKAQRLDWVKQQVTYFWQQHQANVQDTTAEDNYSKWFADYQTESDELSRQQTAIKELEAKVEEKNKA